MQLEASPTDAQLAELVRRCDELSPADRKRLKAILRKRARGCRTNEYIDRIRPNLHPKQRMFLALDDPEVMFGGAAGGGKALAINTEIPTPDGWSTMADLRPGDRVFDENGEPCDVRACSEIMENRPCLRMHFNGGHSIVCDEEHRWSILLTQSRSLPFPCIFEAQGIRLFVESGSTIEIRGKYGKGHFIVGCEPVDSVPVRCIQVSSRSGCFLAGRQMIPTHNSDALLLAALQYVDVPGYSAILFRKTFVDLAGAGALMDRAHQWLRGTDAKWSGLEKSYFFPSGARLAFAYLDSDNDKYKYQGLEFAFVGFDEVTQHPEDNYLYLFSRLRRLEGSDIPIRMRSATNPGGAHGEWVKDRFIPREYLMADEDTQFSRVWRKSKPCEECEETGVLDGEPCFYCDGRGEQSRLFVPSRVQDNPALDQKQYRRSLANLGYVERYRLEHGRWDIMEEGRLFRQSWFRYYGYNGDHIELYGSADGEPAKRLVPSESIIYFMTADTASKTKTMNDYTVISTWALDMRNYNLCLVHAVRDKMPVPDILPTILSEYRRWKAHFVMIEDKSSGEGIIQDARAARGKGISVKAYMPTDGDLVSRSTIAQIRMEAGQIFWPKGHHEWLSPLLAEVIGFGSEELEHDDFVSTLSMAAWYVDSLAKRGAVSARPAVVGSGPRGMLEGRY